MHHRQVVDTSGCHEFPVDSGDACRCGVKKRQIIVDDYFRIYIELFGHKASDKSFFITFGIDTADDRQHVFLFRERISVVDRAVEVYGEMRYGEQRPVESYQTADGAQRILPAQHHPSGY